MNQFNKYCGMDVESFVKVYKKIKTRSVFKIIDNYIAVNGVLFFYFQDNKITEVKRKCKCGVMHNNPNLAYCRACLKVVNKKRNDNYGDYIDEDGKQLLEDLRKRDKYYKPAKRTCLICYKEFESDYITNRRCSDCQRHVDLDSEYACVDIRTPYGHINPSRVELE